MRPRFLLTKACCNNLTSKTTFVTSLQILLKHALVFKLIFGKIFSLQSLLKGGIYKNCPFSFSEQVNHSGFFSF